MSADGGITLEWADGEYRFKLGIGQFRELQEKVNARRILIGAPVIGPMTLLKALQTNDAWPDDVRDILHLGLVGGGMASLDAYRVLKNHFDNSAPLIHMKPAHAILLAGLVGVPAEPVGSKKKKNETVKMSPSSSRPSTEKALQ
jgi:hypothetical protein